MAYIKDGQVVDRPPWRLGAILDFFWAIVNGIAFFFSTMFGVRQYARGASALSIFFEKPAYAPQLLEKQDESSQGPSGKAGKAWRGGSGGGGGGGWGGGGGGGKRPPPPPSRGSKPINGIDRIRGIDHCASAPGGA